MDFLDFSTRFFSPLYPTDKLATWKVLNRDKVDKHVTTNFPRKQFLHTFNASFLREVHLSRLADTDVIFKFSLQASRAKIGQGEMLVSRIW